MAAAVDLRRDFTGLQLRVVAKQTTDAAFTGQLLALAEIYDGGWRSNMRLALAAPACDKSERR